MKVNQSEKIEKNTMSLEIEVDQEEVAKAIQQAHKKLVKKVNIPGFRKGKAPLSVLERYVGKGALLEEAAEIMIFPNYAAAVQETGIEPIDRPNVEIVELDDNKPFTFKVKVDVKPEVELGEYKGIKVEKASYPVTEDDVNKELERLQQRYAKLSELGEEDTIQNDDMATISYQGFVDGVQFEGGTSENHNLGIGSGSFIPGFEEQLIGAKINESRDVNVTFPEEYHSEELAGKEALFKVEIKGIKRKEVAPIDDEFAKDVSEFETLDELKKDIQTKMEESAAKRAEDEAKNEILNKVVEAASVEIPPVMIDQKIQSMLNELNENLGRQGLQLEQYCQFTNTSIEQLGEQYRPQAERAVKTDLVLEQIAKQDNIEVLEEELNQELDKFSKQYNQPIDAIKSTLVATGQMDMLKLGMTMTKTANYLVEQNEIA
ncbi:trigger factor [Dehalobacterium formicoaceticum]|uniref:Trigger factor n=1 Tax=Dehalobacterium formicoaceticum TaxID=51515 RepID=A0ABT1Y2C3_9FIRM|nr:trigger factor [Dehalobacterium formicoaceticum]MCR6545016.1 trigger factor [Dehalobacterium formicoaceticum]